MNNNNCWNKLMKLIDEMEGIRDVKRSKGQDADMIFVERVET